MEKKKTDFKIFGLGLSKTGTSSLGDALNILGFPTIHYPFDSNTYNELRSGQYKLSILAQYAGIVDIPAAPFYAQWDHEYPGSKFILTVREIESWLRSVDKHWELMMKWWDNYPDFKNFHEFISMAVYGCIKFNQGRFRFVYDLHLKNVVDYFLGRENDFLVMDICAGEGWEKLCKFLKVEIPSVPFPHSNEWMHKLMEATQEFKELVKPGRKFILIDQEGFGEEFSAGRQKIPFMEMNGLYHGQPVDDESAIHEFHRLMLSEPDYLVLGWPSFWWLEYYKNLFQSIEAKYKCILANDRLKIYDLRTG